MAGGLGETAIGVPFSLSDHWRSSDFVSANVRGANHFELPFISSVAPLGFSISTYKDSFALHARVVPGCICPLNTSTPSTPTRKVIVCEISTTSRFSPVNVSGAERGVALSVAVGLPDNGANGGAVAASVGIAVGAVPGRNVGVRVGKARVGVPAFSPASWEMIGENCVQPMIALIKQIQITPPMIAKITGNGIGRRVECASEIGAAGASLAAGVATTGAAGCASASGGAGGSGKLGLSAGGRGIGGRSEGKRIAAGLRTGSAGGKVVVGATDSSGIVVGGGIVGAAMG